MTTYANSIKNTKEYLKLWYEDIDEWPQRWAGNEEDIIIGLRLMDEFKTYLLALVAQGRKKKTVKKHADYLWGLGGEIIRDTNENGVSPNLSSSEILLLYVNAFGGPYWRHAYNDKDRQQYDGICRQLYKYISQKQL
jgi:hypothetical protein